MKISTKNISLLACFIFSSFQMIAEANPTALYAPYNHYKVLQEDLSFWTARGQDATSLQKQSIALMALFSVDGNMDHILKAEKKLEKALEQSQPTSSSIYKHIAQIKVKQHKFCEALDVLLVAEQMGDQLRNTHALLFDVYFELGNTDQTIHHLTLIGDTRDFQYLIRAARFEDSEGRLENAIQLLEEAKSKVSANNWDQQSWIHSNLADFYGHAGKIDKSRIYFLKALEYKPSDWYSMKGLAWIEYSYNNKPDRALDILDKLSQTYFIPAVENLRYEILTYQKMFEKAEDVRRGLLKEIDRPALHSSYGTMLFDMVNENDQLRKRLKPVILNDISVRPTPESYAKLVQYYILESETERARQIALDYVVGKTFEPDALRRVFPVLKNYDNNYTEIESILRDADFELGPSVMRGMAL